MPQTGTGDGPGNVVFSSIEDDAKVASVSIGSLCQSITAGAPALVDRGRELGMTNRTSRAPA